MPGKKARQKKQKQKQKQKTILGFEDQNQTSSERTTRRGAYRPENA